MTEENLQIISDMIAMAKADAVINDDEYEFILLVAHKLDVDKSKVDELIEKPIKKTVFKSEIERITQFHRLVLVMNVDAQIHPSETDTLRNYGLRLGVRPDAIEQILSEMKTHKNNMIPADRMVEIFKKYYN
ncbi:TerB family tellurite resistance protein [Dokdonia sp. Hel_I_53]|uniref:TerB family tellurite resistance protein n=1 Tax=Dokdonia sp. Hel_I_53 TaxID=1566287 RepID=UPI00119C70A1|nr:TerB family tellurite resistance protein [Dokdonia sp. Hel_I_53]TVZ51736.1 hypothetical protein OD90_0888 [Dokdonia sp. Hel_I_53]